jgi:hypothetical protein
MVMVVDGLVKTACCITVTATDQLTGRDLSMMVKYEALGTTSPASTSRAQGTQLGQVRFQ